MRKLIVLVTAVMIAFGSLMSGCEKKKAEQPAPVQQPSGEQTPAPAKKPSTGC